MQTTDLSSTSQRLIGIAHLFERPTHVSHPNINALANLMRFAQRDELVHYAGASYRDDAAWHMCREYLLTPDASEAQLKQRALAATGYGYVAIEDIEYVQNLGAR